MPEKPALHDRPTGSGRRTRRVFLGIGTVAFALVAFAVFSGASTSFDEGGLRLFRSAADPSRPLGPTWIAPVAIFITGLGSRRFLRNLLFASAAGLFLTGRLRSAAGLLATGFGGIVFSATLKRVFLRTRPSVVPYLVTVGTSSFPSGHTLCSTVVYLAIASLLVGASPRPGWRLGIIVSGVGIVLAIGVTRVSLGVHYPTDVIAGWLAGGVWLIACREIDEALTRRFTTAPDTGIGTAAGPTRG